MKKKTIEREVYLSDELKEKDIPKGFYTYVSSQKSEEFKHKAKIVLEIEEPPLTFERIRKECVPMKHLLVPYTGDKRLYLGFDNVSDELVTTSLISPGNIARWDKSFEIKDWAIEEYKE